MIVILETLKLARENLIYLQNREIDRLQFASYDFTEVSRLYAQYGLGQAAKLQKILKTLHNESIHDIFEMPFFSKLNGLTYSFALKQIKYRSRIAVDRSWKLIGAMDEFKYLKGGEIYVCLKGDDSGEFECLRGYKWWTLRVLPV